MDNATYKKNYQSHSAYYAFFKLFYNKHRKTDKATAKCYNLAKVGVSYL